MKTTSLLSTALLACTAAAAPVDKRADIDPTILQFALTLEHLENVFYKEAIKNFTLQDFEQAGYSADYYNNLHYIAHDEEQHVLLLESALTALGVKPNAACTYSFPYSDVTSFITLSSVLEGVGTSAYLGAAPLVTSKFYLAVAGAILVTEAKHTSAQRLAIGEVPMDNPYGTALDPTSVFTLAAAFIVSCPSTNMALPFTAFPGLTLDEPGCTCEEPECGQPDQYIKRGEEQSRWGWPSQWPHGRPSTCRPAAAGATIKFTAPKDIPAGSYVTFVNGLSVTSVKGDVQGMSITAQIPAGDGGQAYAFVTSSDVETTFSDASVLFGPAIVEIEPPAPEINFSIL